MSPGLPCGEKNENCFPQPNFQNNVHKDYQWNGIVLLAAIVSILIVLIITMIVYYIYFRLYSNQLQRALRQRPRRRRMSSHGYRLSWKAVRDFHSASQGLSTAAVRALPVFVYTAEDFGEALRCAVCLCEFEENEKGIVLPNCGHRFHADCIDMWFYSHTTCPLCRQEVGLQPENGHVVVDMSSGRGEHGDSSEKVGEGDASDSAELGKSDSHFIKDVEEERRVDSAISTLPMER